jgi:hypothetical protein
MASSFESTKTTSSTLESDERLFVRRQIRHRHWTSYEQRFVLSGRLGSTLSAPPAMGQESQHVHHAWTMYGPASGNVSISINAVIRVGGPQPQ